MKHLYSQNQTSVNYCGVYLKLADPPIFHRFIKCFLEVWVLGVVCMPAWLDVLYHGILITACLY